MLFSQKILWRTIQEMVTCDNLWGLSKFPYSIYTIRESVPPLFYPRGGTEVKEKKAELK